MAYTMSVTAGVGAAGPIQESMADNPLSNPSSQGYNIIRRTPMCCVCCTPQMEWNITDYTAGVRSGADAPPKLSALEFSPFCCRICCHKGARQSSYKVYQGYVAREQAETGTVPHLLTIEKPLTCHTHACFCCFPFYEVKDPSGTPLGTARFACCPCLPTINIEVPSGQPKYRIRPESCCGCCIRPRCGGAGAKCCRVNFTLRDFDNQPISDAMITELWSGAINEILLNRTQYQCKYPPSADYATKSTLLAANLLLDLAIFEKDDQQGGGS